MSLVGNLPYNDRQLQDGTLLVTGSGTAVLTALDLGQANAYSVTEVVNVYAFISASAGTNISASLQSSPDNVTFTNYQSASNPFLVGAGAVSTFKIDPGAPRYLRLSGSGGTSTYGLSLKF